MRAISGFNLKTVGLEEKVLSERWREFMFKFKGMHDSMLGSASTSWGIPQRSMALVLSLSSYAVHPQIPPGSDTVATSGFLLLPLCFTHVRWTAEFGVRGLVTVPSLLAKR
jgi:hypothetical protein